MRKSVFTLASITTVSGVLVVAACSAPAPTNDLREEDQNIVPPNGGGKKGSENGSSGTSGSSGSSGSSGTNTSSSSSSSSSSGGGDGGGAGACGQKANQEECFTCCEQANPKGLEFIKTADTTLGQCLCDANANGACATECAQTACAQKAPAKGDACDTCLGGEKATTCFQQFDQACQGNADCAALLKCDDDSQCESKPQ